MSLARLKGRTPSAVALGCHMLKEHDLRFHKSGKDGSGKCDACFTSNVGDAIYGVLFKIDPAEKPALDKAEGLGYGYDEKEVSVIAQGGATTNATMYVATKICENLKPYTWYVNHVLVGAMEASLPDSYITTKIASVETVEDRDRERDESERAIHR